MPILEQDTTDEPRNDVLLRLADLSAAIDTAAELLTPIDSRAIWQELTGVSCAFRRVGCPKRSCRPTEVAPTETPMQGDLLV